VKYESTGTCISKIFGYSSVNFFPLDNRQTNALPALRRTQRVGEFEQAMTGVRQTVAMMMQ
jgi:hypothetical protein